MAYIIKRPGWHLPDREATPESVYLNRRRFLAAMGAGGLALAGYTPGVAAQSARPGPPLPDFERNPEFADAGRPLSEQQLVESYNNFYEFGFGKGDPAKNAQGFSLEPYTLEIDGLVENPVKLDLDQIYNLGLEERVYRFRCVEAWAMTVPWLGVPLSKVLEVAKPTSDAKFIRMVSFYDPERAPGQTRRSYDWPYHEGLRMDEAMNALTFVAVGLYGKRLLPQSGTPLRIIAPWKYGYKGPKSVVRIEAIAQQPPTFWNTANPYEYKFYSNVDPEVPHPRWSQAKERYLGETVKRHPTQWYNGYGEYVAHLYADMPRKLY